MISPTSSLVPPKLCPNAASARRYLAQTVVVNASFHSRLGLLASGIGCSEDYSSQVLATSTPSPSHTPALTPTDMQTPGYIPTFAAVSVLTDTEVMVVQEAGQALGWRVVFVGGAGSS